MIQNLGNRIEKMQETFNKDLEELKRNQAMVNNTINEFKNTLEGFNSRITEAEERRSDLEDKIVEMGRHWSKHKDFRYQMNKF